MKVVQIPRRFVAHRWGGTETVILQTSRRLIRRGHDSLVLCPACLSVPGPDVTLGIPVRRTSYVYPWFGLDAPAVEQLDGKGGNLLSFSLMRELATMERPDLLHLHARKRLGGIARSVAADRGIPYVLSLHGGLLDVPDDEFAGYTARVRGALEWGRLPGWWLGSRAVERDAAAILAVGRAECRAIQRRLPGARVEYLPNGVDTSAFQHGDGDGFRERFGVPHDARILLTLGRIDPQKNQLSSIETLRRLLPRFPGLHLVLVGHVTDRAYRDRIDRSVGRAGLQRHVTVVEGIDPSSPHLAGALHAAELFVLPSVHEPFGIVVLEAWAAGRAVVASSVGGIPDLIEHGRTGLLASPGDPDGLARLCEQALTDARLRRRLGGEGRRDAVRRYEWERVTDRLLSIYDEVIEEHHRRAPGRRRSGRWTLGLTRRRSSPENRQRGTREDSDAHRHHDVRR